MLDPESVRKRVGARIRAVRARQDLTQAALGARCGFSGKYVSEIERGLRDPSVTTLLRIATGLRCPMAELVYGVDSPVPAEARRVETMLAGRDPRTQRRLAAAFRAVAEAVSPYEE